MNADPVDWPAIIAGWQDAFQGLRVAMQKMGRVVTKMSVSLRIRANDEEHVCGLEARFLVRGGLTADIDTLVRNLLRAPQNLVTEQEKYLVRLLTPSNRARLAAAAIRGYAVHQESRR